MSKELKFKQLTEFPDYAELVGRLARIGEEKVKLGAELQEMEARRLAFTSSRSRPQDEAERLVRGEEPGEEPGVPSLEQIARGRERLRVLELASEVGAHHLREVGGRLSVRICQEARPQFKEAWAELARRLVAASEAACALQAMYDTLDAAGILRSTLPMAIPLSSLDAGNPDGRLNIQVGQIQTDYDCKIERPLLDEAEKRHLELHHEEEARKRKEREAEEKRLARRKVFNPRDSIPR